MSAWKGLLTSLALAASTIPLAGQARANGDGDILYTVSAGDTLYELDQRYFAGKDAIATVARVNNIRNPRALPTGKTLQIPRELLRYQSYPLQIAGFSGPVRIDGQPVTAGMTLRVGSEIQTGPNGFVSFSSSDGAVIAIPSNSRARLIRSRRYLLDRKLDVDFKVLRGRTEVRAPKLKPQERFRVRTPNAVTAVRGTEFRVVYGEEAERSVTEVVEGQVGVSVGDATGIADMGFGIAASNDGLSATQPLLPAPSMDKPGAIQTDETLSFSIDLPEGGVAHRTQLARDAGFVDVIAESVEAAPQATFDSLDDGRYFVRARAISAEGIEGLSDVYSFRRKRVGIEGGVEPSPLADGFMFAWRAAGSGQNFAAFQLWDARTPSDLMIDEVGLSEQGLILTGLETGVYEWRVATMQADEQDGFIKVWSPPQKLTVTE